MREILFRGKRVDNGKWECGFHVMYSRSIAHPYSYTDGDHYIQTVPHNMKFKVDTETVCQYTGLTDKNGKKIFEGDIVAYQVDNDDCPFPNKDTRKRVGRVFFQDWRASFAVAEGRNGSDMCNQDLFNYVRNGNRTEVIGNIYDNPDLIGYKKGAGA